MEAAIEHALLLAEIREHRSLSQTDLAEVLGTSQARVSQLENQSDLYLSTLKRYIEASAASSKWPRSSTANESRSAYPPERHTCGCSST